MITLTVYDTIELLENQKVTARNKYIPIIAISILLLASSCVTYRANMFLINNTTVEQKADFLFREGQRRYNTEVLENSDYYAIPEIRRLFSDTLKLNPLHPEAQKYIDNLDSFKEKKFNSFKATAKKLYATEKRTEAQDYELVYATRMANELNKSDKEISKLHGAIKETRTAVIASREVKLADIQQKISAEKNQQAMLKQLREADRLIRDIEKIDPANKNASKARVVVTEKTDSLAQKDIDAAEKFLAEKKFSEAEDAILRAEKSLAAVSRKPGTKIADVKYRVYYAWSLELYNAKKFQSAQDRVLSAIKTNKTTEAASLKAKIDKAVSTRDFDADIADILASVDARLAKNDPAGAMGIIDETAPKLKTQANKDKLLAKRDAVRAQIKTVYQEGIALYNEEDYESARRKFRTVIEADKEYEQAQAYLDRTETKIRALSGND